MSDPYTPAVPALHADPIPPAMNLRDLRVSLRRPRTMFSAFCTGVTFVLVAIAVVPLFSVLYMLAVRGLTSMNWAFFTEVAPVARSAGGGIGNAILGSAVMVGIAAVITIPTGVLVAVYLAEIGPNTKLATGVRFCAKLLTGLPSIIAGVFIYGLMVVTLKTFSAWAGACALSLLMLPMIILTAEEAIKMVPAKIREAAYGMGCTRTQVIFRVLLPTALPGILTGVMLALARSAGETAPLLFTAQYAPRSWVWHRGGLNLNRKTQSLAVFIYDNAGNAAPNLDQAAWGAALVLVAMVLAFNLMGQFFSWQTSKHQK